MSYERRASLWGEALSRPPWGMWGEVAEGMCHMWCRVQAHAASPDRVADL